MAQVKAYVGAAVVLDVRTGEVLAQASYPFYDAANPFASGRADRGDAATGMVVEPGLGAQGDRLRRLPAGGRRQAGRHGPGAVRPSPRAPPPSPTPTRIRRWPTDDAARHPGLVVQCRHDRARRQARAAEALRVPARVRPRRRRPARVCRASRPGWSSRRRTGARTATARSRSGMGVSVTPLQMAAVYAAIANGGVWVAAAPGEGDHRAGRHGHPDRGRRRPGR